MTSMQLWGYSCLAVIYFVGFITTARINYTQTYRVKFNGLIKNKSNSVGFARRKAKESAQVVAGWMATFWPAVGALICIVYLCYGIRWVFDTVLGGLITAGARKIDEEYDKEQEAEKAKKKAEENEKTIAEWKPPEERETAA